MVSNAHNVSQCVRHKSANGMPRPTSLSLVYSPKVMMGCHVTSFYYVLLKGDACHGRRCLTSVLPKDHMGMQRPSSSDRACYPNTMMTCHVRRRLTCILSKGNDGIPCTISSVRECFIDNYGMSHPTLSDCLCSLREKMACLARHCPIVCNARTMKACNIRRSPKVCSIQEG